MRTSTVAERFWSKVAKPAESDGCWVWTAFIQDDGYGVLFVCRTGKASINVRAHRLSWELNVGPIPEGLCVLHKCDNPPCVNPDHLFLGTQIDNNNDKMAKGRYRGGCTAEKAVRGSAHYRAKLNDASAGDILRRYANGESISGLALEYGVAYHTARALTSRRTWKHLG